MSECDVRFVPDLSIDLIRGRLIRNPNYGGPSVGRKGWTWRPEVSKAAKPEFHDALAKSISSKGVRNPVLVWSFPEGVFLTFGGSRVRAAKRAKLSSVPAIINDYTGEFRENSRVTEENWESYFTDVPSTHEFTEDGFDYHYNLERARRHNHDPAGFAWLEGDKPSWIKKEFPWLDQPE